MASVDMVPLKNGRVMVPVNVAGREVYFVLATAVPMTSIDAALVDQLNVPREHSRVKFVGLSGEVSDTLATVPTFGIGRLKAESVELLVTDSHRNKAAMAEAGGLVPSGALGADFLRAYDVDLDFGANKLNLISRDHCEGNVVYWKSERLAKLPMLVMDNDKIAFSMNLDGHDLETILNTGVPMSTINMRTAKTLYDVDNDSPGNKVEGKLGDGTVLYSHVFKTLSAEGLAISNPKIVLMPNRAEQTIQHMRHGWRGPLLAPAGQQQPDLVLGMAELRHLHVYIDYHYQTIYLTPADAGSSAPATTAP
ncbi:MAG: aspartyl protease family protein [Alphaproteobacteria bacterium]|nr:aspartyl protease family protein [Alphaproteobacteria bacterium]